MISTFSIDLSYLKTKCLLNGRYDIGFWYTFHFSRNIKEITWESSSQLELTFITKWTVLQKMWFVQRWLNYFERGDRSEQSELTACGLQDFALRRQFMSAFVSYFSILCDFLFEIYFLIFATIYLICFLNNDQKVSQINTELTVLHEHPAADQNVGKTFGLTPSWLLGMESGERTVRINNGLGSGARPRAHRF